MTVAQEKHCFQPFAFAAIIVVFSLLLSTVPVSSLPANLKAVERKSPEPRPKPHAAVGGGQQTLLTGETVIHVFGKGLVARKDSAGLTYQHQDILSSNRFSTDATGKLTSIRVQQPYGNNVEELGMRAALENDYKFTGKEQDGDLYYFGGRHYDSKAMRFLSADPVTRADQSSYWYADGNPMTMIDPNGQAPVRYYGPLGFSTHPRTGETSLEGNDPYAGRPAVTAYRGGMAVLGMINDFAQTKREINQDKILLIQGHNNFWSSLGVKMEKISDADFSLTDLYLSDITRDDILTGMKNIKIQEDFDFFMMETAGRITSRDGVVYIDGKPIEGEDLRAYTKLVLTFTPPEYEMASEASADAAAQKEGAAEKPNNPAEQPTEAAYPDATDTATYNKFSWIISSRYYR